jgi:hypothetical protein
MAVGKIELHVAQTDEEDVDASDQDGEVAYVSLPGHPGCGKAGVVARQVRLRDLIADHGHADVYLDFDKDGCLIGLEILT